MPASECLTLPDGTRVAAGLEALEAAVDGLRSTVQEPASPSLTMVETREQLEALDLAVRSEIGEVETALKELAVRRQVIDSQLEVAIKEESQLLSTHESAARRKDELEAELRQHLSTETDETLKSRIGELEVTLGAVGFALRTLSSQAASRTSSKDIELRREQLEKLLADHRHMANGLKVEMGRLEASLTERQGAGIDESIDRIENELEELRIEQKKGEARLNALLLLKEELLAAQLRAKQRYLDPVTGRIEPYLQVLFPGARVKCTEELALETVERSGKQEPLEILSNGTREQIAVLTRLAFADLLRDRGRPSAIILDDSLAFSDASRLNRMFEVRKDRAKKVQITILSSRDRAFERLGANSILVEPLA